jgi:hypothetical protein
MNATLLPTVRIASLYAFAPTLTSSKFLCPMIELLHYTMDMLLRLSYKWIPNIFQCPSPTLLNQLCFPTRALCFLPQKTDLPSVTGSKRLFTKTRLWYTTAQLVVISQALEPEFFGSYSGSAIWLAVWLWASNLTSLFLNFSICKVREIKKL